jgi:hypothetical protein
VRKGVVTEKNATDAGRDLYFEFMAGSRTPQAALVLACNRLAAVEGAARALMVSVKCADEESKRLYDEDIGAYCDRQLALERALMQLVGVEWP